MNSDERRRPPAPLPGPLPGPAPTSPSYSRQKNEAGPGRCRGSSKHKASLASQEGLAKFWMLQYCTCLHTHTHTHKYACTHKHTHTHVHTHMHMHTHTCATLEHTHAHTHLQVTHILAQICVHTQIHTCTYTSTHTCTHTRTCNGWAKCPPGLVQERLKFLYKGLPGITFNIYEIWALG